MCYLAQNGNLRQTGPDIVMEVGGNAGPNALEGKQVRDAVTMCKITDREEWNYSGRKVIKVGTSIYKFSVLTGPRHFAHVAFGGVHRATTFSALDQKHSARSARGREFFQSFVFGC